MLPQGGRQVYRNGACYRQWQQLNLEQAQEHARTGAGKTQNLIFGEATAKVEKKTKPAEADVPAASAPATEKKKSSGSGSKLRPGKYVKYNKYAAARKAAKSGEKPKERLSQEEKALKEAMRPKFGKSLGRAAVAQRLAASPKSASLRKTSKNNPINKTKRAATRNKPKGE